ncbi:MAG TPA: TIGR03862 family flavoprotein, partial [Bacteroidia bacterium]|nr:TIGR03862 family flavoprotein [Bacteroidia bacterium]
QYEVNLYEQNAAPARKFLVAGQGGFNLTHSETPDLFLNRYIPASFLEQAFHSFNNEHLRTWLNELGIPTYIGSSKRVFPEKGIKPIEVLNAFLNRLQENGVVLHTRHTWKGWDAQNQLLFETETGPLSVQADLCVFALGGGSWKVTGSDGQWTERFQQKGISVLPFHSSNCAVGIQWPEGLPAGAEGQALKNIRISAGGESRDGELAITRFGLEGGAVYALIPRMRKALHEKEFSELSIDLKPQLSRDEILSRISIRTSNHSISHRLREQVKLTDVQLLLLRQCCTREEFVNPASVADKIKRLRLTVNALAPVEEAISTAGGIALAEVDNHFQLQKLPGTYVIGEMLDWDAPTGGYLLQACFSMGHFLAEHLNSVH